MIYDPGQTTSCERPSTVRPTHDAARDATTDGEWEFHNAVNGAETQVEARYGPDSDQIQSPGRKKKSEYARPTRRQSSKKDSGQ